MSPQQEIPAQRPLNHKEGLFLVGMNILMGLFCIGCALGFENLSSGKRWFIALVGFIAIGYARWYYRRLRKRGMPAPSAVSMATTVVAIYVLMGVAAAWYAVTADTWPLLGRILTILVAVLASIRMFAIFLNVRMRSNRQDADQA